MEYLHRVLHGLGSNHNFNYHPKCEKLKIINLCFVDDILIFLRGDRGSMKLMMNKMKEVWFVRNRIIFQGDKKEELHWETIKNVILRRVENNRKLMMYCNRNL
ncbi:hypothetical protein HKD37_11G032419 [Glycine soja]